MLSWDDEAVAKPAPAAPRATPQPNLQQASQQRAQFTDTALNPAFVTKDEPKVDV